MRPITSLLLAAAALLAGFYSGFHYELGKLPAASTQPAATLATQTTTRSGQGSGAAAGASGSGAAAAGLGAAGAGAFGGGFVGRGTVGTVQSVAGGVLTISDSQGNPVKVTLGNATILKSVKGGPEDLVQGATVAVQGQRNADGTITANSVTLTPPRAG